MNAFPPAGDLVKHKEGMLLIDRIVAVEGEMLRSETTIRADSIFFQPGKGVPGYIGFEFMAQTISAFDGLQRRAKGKAPVIGFLLGCRKYAVARPFFIEGEILTTESNSLLGEEEMSSFDCRIFDAGGAVLASALINVFRPDDSEAFLRAQL